MKFEKISFSVIGGDQRQIKLCDYLINHGYRVNIFGFSNVEVNPLVKKSETLEEAIKYSNIIIGPIPCSQNDRDLFAKYYGGKVKVEDIFKVMNKHQIFMAGRLTDKIQKNLTEYGITYIDLLEREDMAVRNAIPTAEGAIQYAMENSDITLHGSKCMVLGFGRCGKVLAHMLKGIGADLSVEARSLQDLAYIESYGYKPVPLGELTSYIDQYDFIFNTIPSLILDSKRLIKMKEDCLIIELASKPGGVDLETANKLGIKVIDGQSLPGKVAARTAAKIIFDTILNAYSDLGVIL